MNIVCGGLNFINKWNYLDSCENNFVGEDFWTVMESVLPAPSYLFSMASIDNTVIITGRNKDYVLKII